MKTWIERKYGRKLIRMLIGGRGGTKISIFVTTERQILSELNNIYCHCQTLFLGDDFVPYCKTVEHGSCLLLLYHRENKPLNQSGSLPIYLGGICITQILLYIHESPRKPKLLFGFKGSLLGPRFSLKSKVWI